MICGIWEYKLLYILFVLSALCNLSQRLSVVHCQTIANISKLNDSESDENFLPKMNTNTISSCRGVGSLFLWSRCKIISARIPCLTRYASRFCSGIAALLPASFQLPHMLQFKVLRSNMATILQHWMRCNHNGLATFLQHVDLSPWTWTEHPGVDSRARVYSKRCTGRWRSRPGRIDGIDDKRDTCTCRRRVLKNIVGSPACGGAPKFSSSKCIHK